jgi:protein tyrosine phosphatase (PTP) superfamily phosphohydrolase (DUF442 family)
MEYFNFPFKTPTQLSDEIFDAARKVLNDQSKKPILLHCSSANRVGAIWLAHRVLDHGLSFDDAAKEAETVGMKLPAFKDKAKDYIDRKKAR